MTNSSQGGQSIPAQNLYEKRLRAMASQVRVGDYDPVEMLSLAAKEIRWVCRHIDSNSIVRMSAENTAAHIDKFVAAARSVNYSGDGK